MCAVMWIWSGFIKYSRIMIEGHGDDAYRYGDIKNDFSSNICAHNHHQALMNHLMAHPELISHYPEPEAWSLETIIADQWCHRSHLSDSPDFPHAV